VANVDPETCAVDEQMGRSIGREPVEADFAELLQPSRQSGMVGDREVDFE
jgi:hypothetical protein